MAFSSAASGSARRGSCVSISVIALPLILAGVRTDRAVQRREVHRRLLGLAGSARQLRSRATPAKCRSRNRLSAGGEGGTTSTLALPCRGAARVTDRAYASPDESPARSEENERDVPACGGQA